MTSPHPATPPEPTYQLGDLAPARRRRWPWVAALAALVLGAAGGAAWALWPTDDDRAVAACKGAVSAKLRSPSTAKWGDPAIDHEDVSIVWRISGDLDAENGFGAMVRGQFRCTLTHERDGSWTVGEATVNQR